MPNGRTGAAGGGGGMNWLRCWFKIAGHNIERSDYVITNATLTVNDTVLAGRDIRINLSTCLRCGQQWHETIVEKAKGVAV